MQARLDQRRSKRAAERRCDRCCSYVAATLRLREDRACQCEWPNAYCEYVHMSPGRRAIAAYISICVVHSPAGQLLLGWAIMQSARLRLLTDVDADATQLDARPAHFKVRRWQPSGAPGPMDHARIMHRRDHIHTIHDARPSRTPSRTLTLQVRPSATPSRSNGCATQP